MKEVSVHTMKRYLRRYYGQGITLTRWHKDMRCYIQKELIRPHRYVFIARVSDINKYLYVSSNGKVYSYFRSTLFHIQGYIRMWMQRLKRRCSQCE